MACILFVDDDPYTLETLTKSVQLFGHKAFHAASGKEALAQAIAHSPDLIMTDMMLPDMDGLNLLNQLHLDAATAGIPVVMLSASPEVDLAELCKAAGAEMFLNKPVRLQTLLDIIQRYASG
ncbi:MAG TPA: response regulator [Anaerolineales bacterium]|nr:response regulator [Anaerolineales bacterium]